MAAQPGSRRGGGQQGGQLYACGSREGCRARNAATCWVRRTCVSVLPRRRCCAMRFKSSASSSSGGVTPWSMRTAGRPAARERSAVSPSTSIAARGRRVALGKRGRYARIQAAPLFRSAITFAARRALAAGIHRSTCTTAEARFAERPARLARPPDPARCFDCPVDTALLLSTRVIWLRTWFVGAYRLCA